ncbi:unnamed protein product [Pieris macdunnoughi]|uniref:Uncharacterized protein n=1 Tax=Pieris macdunnoughi TaxID=345717 RepID=A0A821S4Z3_9NEOP|nr:unnamed protein product [Pieris macdunnoughi]
MIGMASGFNVVSPRPQFSSLLACSGTARQYGAHKPRLRTGTPGCPCIQCGTSYLFILFRFRILRSEFCSLFVDNSSDFNLVANRAHYQKLVHASALTYENCI